MTRLLASRWLKLSVGLFCCLLISVLSTAWYFRIWSWRDFEIYEMMSRECHPVWKDLHWGRVYSGQDVDEAIAATKPLRVQRYGEWAVLEYQDGGPNGLCMTGITITAKKGHLACAWAWSCTWDRKFFEVLTPEDWARLSEARDAHWRSLRRPD
jgi:hypothetical protein